MGWRMAPDAIGVCTLKRLAELPTGGHPVLGVYLDLDSETHSTSAAMDELLESLPGERGLSRVRPDVDSIQAVLRAQPGPVRDAHGLTVFSSAQAGVLEAVRLPHPVSLMEVLDTLPWLERLTDLTIAQNWGVAVVTARTARLFRGGARSLGEFASFDAHEQLGAHMQRMAERLYRAHERRPFAHLVIVAPTELHGLIDSSLNEQLRAARAEE
jgi:hypothetical protein